MSSDSMPKRMMATILGDWLTNHTTGAKVGLYTNNVVPTPATTLADLTEATGSWYSQQDAVYGQVFQEDDNSLSIDVQSCEFDGALSMIPTAIYGHFCVASDGTTLLHARNLDTPKVLNDDLDSLVVYPSFTVKPVVVS